MKIVVDKKIGKRLLALRHERGLSQRDLGEKSGYSYAYVSRIEAGERQPSVRALRKFAQVLGTTAHYLETGDRHGLYVYVTKDDLIEAAERGEELAALLALENNVWSHNKEEVKA